MPKKKDKKGWADIAGGVWAEAKEFGKVGANQATGFAGDVAGAFSGTDVKGPHGFTEGKKKKMKKKCMTITYEE